MEDVSLFFPHIVNYCSHKCRSSIFFSLHSSQHRAWLKNEQPSYLFILSLKLFFVKLPTQTLFPSASAFFFFLNKPKPQFSIKPRCCFTQKGNINNKLAEKKTGSQAFQLAQRSIYRSWNLKNKEPSRNTVIIFFLFSFKRAKLMRYYDGVY